jgi:glyoxylase-like metal-dependent hydrolase (beta-lactamase superfamily II)
MLASATAALVLSLFGQVAWFEPFPAHRVVGNVYYVGSKDLASYLITTDAGHVLINSGFERTVPLIRSSVESLGFKLTDVKILLASHAHSDHVAGHALARELTGAKVYVMRGDDRVIATGGEGQYLYGANRWKPCPVDRVLNDGDEVKIGDVTLVAHRTPGHTRGCTTWTWRVTEGGKSYDVVVIGSPNVNPGYVLAQNAVYPEIADDFAATFKTLAGLPCDVFLGAHGTYYGMIAKYDRSKGKPGGNPFMDPDGYRDFVARKAKAFRETLAAQQRATPAPAASDGERWWSHVAFLADDALEGRDTGSPGHRKAAEYVVDQFRKLGLQPAGPDGFLQPVPLESRTIDEPRCRLSLVRDGVEAPLELGEDAILSLRVGPAPSIEAPLVFAGFGLSIPEVGHDDFRDLDARGKLVVYLRGAPPKVPGPLAAHAQSEGERAEALRKAGALGSIGVFNPKHMDIPWERIKLSRFFPAMTLKDASLDDNRGLKLSVAVNPAHADKFLTGSGHDTKELLEAADAGRPLPHFDIPARLKAIVAVTRAEVLSHNVVALLPGSDPALENEYVVFSAHLDHIGIGKPIGGDAIYNGAMDNASGVASLLDVAEILKKSGATLRRPVLFAAVTGEEKGLLGSKFFAHHPTIGRGRIVADLNCDMFLPIFPLRRLTAFGSDESDLGADVAAVAEASGIALEPDPEPLRNVFIRSDQYSFIRLGIPSLMVKIGYAKGSPEEAATMRWLKERYHAPSDDLAQPIEKAAAAAFDGLMARLLERVANRDERPRWKGSSFFKRFAQ